MKQDELDSVLYFRSHIVYNNGGFTSIKNRQVITLQKAPSTYRKILRVLEKNTTKKDIKSIIKDRIAKLEEESASSIGQNYGIDFYEYNNFIAKYSDIRIGTGAATIKEILNNINLSVEQRKVKEDLNKHPENNVNYRRNKVIESFILSKQNPASMIFDILPIIPADLRPLIQLDGGRHSTVDINELYRRVIIRNNRLKQ
jgi:DNA-directed RNA polymerase subunit beta'